VQLFAEFFFEIINERDEPLVLVFESLKAFLRLREYRRLVSEERIHTYVEFETYKNIKDT
jgi:hypothetical protein